MAVQVPSILFLCTGNSCRSQMAEGWMRKLHGDKYRVFSAGLVAHGLNLLAVQVMQESGVDISTHQSQRLDEFDDVQFDYVVTVCGHADENCPVLPAATRKIHVPFDDPPKLAEQAHSEEEKVAPYRRVRDEIRTMAADLPDRLTAEFAPSDS